MCSYQNITTNGSQCVNCLCKSVCKYDPLALHCAILMNTCKINSITETSFLYVLNGLKVTSPEHKRRSNQYIDCSVIFVLRRIILHIGRYAGPFVHLDVRFHRFLVRTQLSSFIYAHKYNYRFLHFFFTKLCIYCNKICAIRSVSLSETCYICLYLYVMNK